MAVATSIATQRLLFVPLLIALGGSMEVARWLSIVCFGAAFAIHCTVAELWIRSTRAPEAGSADAEWGPGRSAQAGAAQALAGVTVSAGSERH